MSQNSLNVQTVLKPGMMPESQTLNRTDPELLKLGYLDKGTGKHQSNMIYGVDGIAPAEYAVQHKEPFKVVVKCKEK